MPIRKLNTDILSILLIHFMGRFAFFDAFARGDKRLSWNTQPVVAPHPCVFGVEMPFARIEGVFFQSLGFTLKRQNFFVATHRVSIHRESCFALPLVRICWYTARISWLMASFLKDSSFIRRTKISSRFCCDAFCMLDS